MNETELRDMFDTLTRDPAPSRYDTESVHTESARRQRRKWSAVVGIVVTGVAIAGTALLFGPHDTADPDAAGGPATSKGSVDLLGEWKVTALFDPRGTGSVPTNSKVGALRVQFNSARLTAATPCNYIRAAYRQSGPDGMNVVLSSNTLVATPRDRLDPSLVYCVDPLYQRLLTVRHASQSDGVLYLQDANENTIATLERVSTNAVAINLEGEWKVTALLDAEGRSVLASDKVRIRFNAGTIAGDTECNGIDGDYVQSGPGGRDLTFENLESSWVGCIESQASSRLRDVRHASESNGILKLLDSDETTIATLERVGSTSEAVRHYEPCDGDSIKVSAHSGLALGSKGLRLTVTRTSGKPCVLPAYPRKVEFSYRDALLTLPTRLDPTKPAGRALLVKGHPATAVFLWGNWCAPEVHNDRVAIWIGKRRFEVPGFGTSPGCGANGGAPGAESLNIQTPITIGFFAAYERIATSMGRDSQVRSSPSK